MMFYRISSEYLNSRNIPCTLCDEGFDDEQHYPVAPRNHEGYFGAACHRECISWWFGRGEYWQTFGQNQNGQYEPISISHVNGVPVGSKAEFIAKINHAMANRNLPLLGELVQDEQMTTNIRGVAVCSAANAGFLEIVMLLLQNAEPISDRHRVSALWVAEKRGDSRMFEFLLGSGEISSREYNALLALATRHNHEEICTILFRKYMRPEK